MVVVDVFNAKLFGYCAEPCEWLLWLELVDINGTEKHASDYLRKVYPVILNLVSIIICEWGYEDIL